MEVLYPHCAGLDVHKESVVACARHIANGKVKIEVKTFKTTTAGLLSLSDWLSSEGCTHIAMEATGIYWKPVWHILCDGEFQLVLANAAHVKNVPGRKTDVNDATWLADLMAHGLIRASFVPDEPTQQMRDLLRTRKQFARERTSHVQRIQKTLEDANIKLDTVVTDILGLSGRRILEALIAGQTMPQTLASLAHRRIHASTDQLEAALRGRVTEHHRFLLKLHLDQIDGLDAAIVRIDEEVNANVRALSLRHRPLEQHSWRRSPFGPSPRIGDRDRHEPFPNSRPSGLMGRLLSQERRECRQTSLHTPEEGRSLAQNSTHPMRLGRDSGQGQLSPSPIPSPALQTGSQKGHLRCCRLHTHCRLPHAQKRHILRGSRSPVLRQPRKGKAPSAPRPTDSESRL